MRMCKHEAKFEVGCRRLLWALAGVWLVTGCGPAELAPPEQGPLSTEASPLGSDNSLTPNGLSLNGLSLNGLSLNGLSLNGLSTSTFSSWFNSQPASVSDMVMKYVVRCAVPSGQTRTWTNPVTGVQYTWPGGLGLTPSWASGMPTTETEEQLITACLAAHVNKYGVSMQISLLGRDAQGSPLPVTYTEWNNFNQKEATFYGNAFRNEGIYVCRDQHLRLGSSQSSSRACALGGSPGSSSGCGPMISQGICDISTSCQTDRSGLFYSSCFHNGKAYKVLSTRIRPQDIYRCGDGVCQVSEACGTGATPNSCRADCGACP